MPWYVWLLIAAALGSIVGSLLLLRDSANKMPLSEEQIARMKERNRQLEAEDKQER